MGDAGQPAAFAEERPLEVVVVHTTTLSGDGAGFDDVLNSFEKFFADERLVAPFELLALVDDVADVIAVTKHVRQLAN
ncbi:hypothetical protein [Streptomyces aquilus]|uniref:hypothetical protein n=1 Tax=Streptomyces aquilus TaxID=2548456 RepID=UPI00368154DC